MKYDITQNFLNKTTVHIKTKTIICLDPYNWSGDQIHTWLAWARRKLPVSHNIDPNVFPVSGPELCAMSESDFTRVSGDSGRLLFRHITILREPFTGFISPPMPVLPPPPSYRDRAKRLSSSSTCSTSSQAHSVQSAPASLSSSSKSSEKISGECFFIFLIISRNMEVMTHE